MTCQRNYRTYYKNWIHFNKIKLKTYLNENVSEICCCVTYGLKYMFILSVRIYDYKLKTLY